MNTPKVKTPGTPPFIVAQLRRRVAALIKLGVRIERLAAEADLSIDWMRTFLYRRRHMPNPRLNTLLALNAALSKYEIELKGK